ncbi:DNA polymerase III subunit gamma/tau [Buchnera aphidicola]|uniref:DNA polymerase III subunit gamma/tau n=1 Tax=Buchnera aphidicola TaxID=9 RepID=UPI00346434A7
MHYIVLARKWRPQSFDSIIGQNHIITTLLNSFTLNKIHQSWIFYGTRGVGKTTIARLLSKSLNCKNRNQIYSCNKCKNCKNIQLGCFPDIIEVDAASKTRVENIKEILDTVKYIPIQGKFKIYLIDEVHMLSKHSFNALLKILEEPPKYAKFILITTNINKVPDTIISRCMYFYFTPIDITDIKKNLINILNEEKIFFEEEAVHIIAEKSEGSIRDSLNLTEQVMMFSNQKITLDSVFKIFGMISKEKVLNIILSIFKKNTIKLFKILKKIYNSNIDLEKILIEILKIFHKIAIIIIKKSQKKKKRSYHTEKIIEISKKINFSELKKYYQIILNGRKNLFLAPNKKIGIEITLLNLLNEIKNKIIF